MSLIPDFCTLLPRLVATYEAGRLVPFIGSGMSRLACTDWPAFVEALETAAAQPGAMPLDGKTPRDVLVRRADRAVRTLKRGDPEAFAKAVRAGLLSPNAGDAVIPSQTRLLARVSWPLVLSTNYDNCYAAAFQESFPEAPLAVVGRGAEDCQRVLNSLSTAGRSLLWALQGYLADVPFGGLRSAVTPGLAGQLVVGHEEYRRVTYRDTHFRRAFAEVFRQRSLLFLGVGLQESYLQELFGEVLEIYGPATRPHYAFIQKDEVDPEFMLARFQIVVVEYTRDQHGELEEMLAKLADGVTGPARTSVAWSWGRIDMRGANWASVPHMEVVRGPLPIPSTPGDRAAGECLAVSAGGSGSNFFFSRGIFYNVMQAWGVEPARTRPSTPEKHGVCVVPDEVIGSYLGAFDNSPVFGVRARAEHDQRGLAHIYDASLALFEHVAARFRVIRMQLLAAGGTDKTGGAAAQYDLRNYPERFSFIQTVRAWGAWRAKNPAVDCRLVMHVMLDAVCRDIASGRIDVLELLSCADIRFFVEVVAAADEVERRLFQTMPTLTLDELVSDLRLSADQWTVQVTPPPTGDDNKLKLTSKTLPQTLQMLGVVPGSTVHFRRV